MQTYDWDVIDLHAYSYYLLSFIKYKCETNNHRKS